MRIFFITVSIFVLSLLVVIKAYRYIGSKQRIYPSLVKYQIVIMFFVTLILISAPFILLAINGELITLRRLANAFVMILLISTLVGLMLERVRMLIFKKLSDKEKMKRESENPEPVYGSENDWRIIIEQRTLESYGLDSTVGVPSDSIDRLGNALSVPLGQEIDLLEVEQVS